MPNGSLKRIVAEFDTILSDDKNLSSKTGLKLSMSVLREALDIVSDLQTKYNNISDRVETIERESAAEKRRHEEKKEDEKWSRRVIFGTALAGLTMLILNGLIFLFSTIPLINKMIEAAKP